jgi:hypothetical protein
MRPHLCQPIPGRSCGACCGLYNFQDRSQEALTQRLLHHTKSVKEIGLQNQDGLKGWAQEEHLRSLPSILVRDLPTCHFIGFLEGGAVGCLLHPLVTHGQDLRDLGVYQDKNICQSFECPSFTWLSTDELWAILQATVGWYDYGLVVTDVELLREVCRLVIERRGASFVREKLLQDTIQEKLAIFFSWKVSWPFRDMKKRFGTFDVERQNGLEIPRASIDYAALNCTPSAFNKIFLCLESVFTTPSQLTRAEAMVEAALSELDFALS